MPGAQPPAEPRTEPRNAAEPEQLPEQSPQSAEQQPKPAEQSDDRPPWEKSGEPFDPEHAWKLIQNLRNENAQIKERTDPIVAEWEQLRRASQTDSERAQEDIATLTELVDDITAERDTWRGRAVRAKAEAIAAAKFVDAETALALIGDLSEYAGPEGIDIGRLTARLDQLAADKPFLVAPPPQQGFAPNRGQGQSGNGPLTPAQLAAHAEAQQDWKASIAAKTQQLMDLRNSS